MKMNKKDKTQKTNETSKACKARNVSNTNSPGNANDASNVNKIRLVVGSLRAVDILRGRSYYKALANLKMRAIAAVTLFTLLLSAQTLAVPRRVPPPAPPRSIAYSHVTYKGIHAHVVKLDLHDPKLKVSVVTAAGGVGAAEPFALMVRRTRPVAAVTGTYFDLRSRLPVGDIIVDGDVLHRGVVGTALTITATNQVRFQDVPWGRSIDWTGHETVLMAGPRLIRGGQVALYPKEQGFRDSGLFTYRRRIAVGLTSHNRLVFVAVPKGILLRQLAQLMKWLGCVEAMNLDGGTSAAMYYRGAYLVKPGRWMTNILVAYENVPPSARPLATLAASLGTTTFTEFRLKLIAMKAGAAHYQRGQAAYEQQQFQKALEALAQAVQLVPGNTHYRQALGNAYLAMGLVEDAALSYVQAGHIHLSQGRIDEAVEQYRNAVRIAPNEAAPHRALAAGLRAKGEVEAAHAELLKAEQIEYERALMNKPQPSEPSVPILRPLQPTIRPPTPKRERTFVRANLWHYQTDPSHLSALAVPPQWVKLPGRWREFLLRHSQQAAYAAAYTLMHTIPPLP